MYRPIQIASVFAVSLLAVSCSTKEVKHHQTGFTLFATVESGPKSHISDEYGALEWEPGDAIAVFENGGGDAVLMVTEQGGTTAAFTTDTPFSPSSNVVFALYPFDEEAGFSNNLISTELPSNQDGVCCTYDPFSFISAGSGSCELPADSKVSVRFYNVCGGIRFTLDSDDITSVTLEGNNSEILAGKFDIDLGNEIPSAQLPLTGSTCVTLNADDSFQSSEDEEVWYYITVLPQALSKGFTLTFFRSDGTSFKTSCQCPINVSRSRYSSLRKADLQQSLDAIVTGNDLSIDGKSHANCYIVSEPGYYKIPLVFRDLPQNFVSEPYSANVLWETYNTDVRPSSKSLIDNLCIKNDYLFFRVGEDSFTNGNAVVAVFNDEGCIIWSWHIWICKDYNPLSTAMTIDGGSTVIMDRNLGALSPNPSNPLSGGMMYQWGRKDPFPGSYSASGDQMRINWEIVLKDNGYLNLIPYFREKPWYFGIGNDWLYSTAANNTLWDDSTDKLYDPCPYGWKVPSAEHLKDMDPTLFPLCGFINKEGKLTECGNCAKIWTSTPNGTSASSLDIYTNNPSSGSISADYRSEGHSVRCIKQ